MTMPQPSIELAKHTHDYATHKKSTKTVDSFANQITVLDWYRPQQKKSNQVRSEKEPFFRQYSMFFGELRQEQ